MVLRHIFKGNPHLFLYSVFDYVWCWGAVRYVTVTVIFDNWVVNNFQDTCR